MRDNPATVVVTEPLRRGGRGRGWRERHPGVEWLIAAIALLVAGVVLGPFLYFHVVEGRTPGRLSLPPAAGAPKQVVPGPVTGTWKVAAGSQAGYRVKEILFGQSHVAVGRTSKVTGGISISGTTVTAADFSVDMASVKSNQSGRNFQFAGAIMATGRYPTGNFRLTRAIELGSVPPVGTIVTEQATGDLTLRGHTRSVTFPLHAERVPGAIDINAEIPIRFSLWKIPNPSFAITRVGNIGTVEVLLHLVRGAAS